MSRGRASGCVRPAARIGGVPLWVAGLCAVATGAPRVTITGGADASGAVYTWTVTSDHPSPAVFVEFPHYHAVLFFAPPRWTTDSTYLVNIGVEDRPGVCRASADGSGSGIVRGTSAEFRMQVSSDGTQRGRGNVRVRFADGIEVEVPGVEVPVRIGRADRYMPLIGLGAIAALAVLARALRGRKRR